MMTIGLTRDIIIKGRTVKNSIVFTQQQQQQKQLQTFRQPIAITASAFEKRKMVSFGFNVTAFVCLLVTSTWLITMTSSMPSDVITEKEPPIWALRDRAVLTRLKARLYEILSQASPKQHEQRSDVVDCASPNHKRDTGINDIVIGMPDLSGYGKK